MKKFILLSLLFLLPNSLVAQGAGSGSESIYQRMAKEAVRKRDERGGAFGSHAQSYDEE